MPLESATYINQLNAANPSSTDSVAQADDHLRLIKAALVNTFPNINAPITASPAQLNSLATNGVIPVGGIIMWSGSIASIPSGWALCDGTAGTPNLRDRFIVGAGTTFAPGATGGAFTVTSGSHTHTMAAAGGHNHSGSAGGTALTVAQLPSHTHTWSGTQTSEDNNYTAGSNWLREGSTVNSSAFTVTTNATGEGATHTHTIDAEPNHTHTLDAGGEHTHNITPPYYALCFIMKT